MTAHVTTTPLFNRVALIGFGLIGGSIARAARLQGLAGEIVTTARSEKTRTRVAELGIVDRVVATNAEAVDGADLVILCIPVGACGAVAQEIAPHLKAIRPFLAKGDFAPGAWGQYLRRRLALPVDRVLRQPAVRRRRR